MASATTTTTTPSLPSTHRALVQDIYAQPPTVKTVPAPQPHPGAAVLHVLCAKVVSYMGAIYDGTRKYPYPTPLTLGTSALARVAAVPPDATFLAPGMLVLFDCTVRSRDRASHIFLSAIHQGDSAGSAKLMREVWRDGSYAEFVRVPLENCFPLDEQRLLGAPAQGGLGYALDDLPAFFNMLVPYGGLSDVGLKPGETVIVAPATGGFGGAAVKIALAMGAGKVIAMGRNEKQLATLVAEGNGRVVSAKMTGDWQEEKSELARHGEVDIFFDISPAAAWDSSHFKAGILAVRPKGRVSLMGGQLEDVKIPIRKVMHENLTLKGTWMYSRDQVFEVVKLMESGVLKMRDGESMKCVGAFELEDWKKAFDLAEKTGGDGP